MRLQRDTWLAIGLLVMLVLVTIVVVVWEEARAEKPPYSSYASQPNGALALREWMTVLGYEVLPDRLSAFEPPDRARLLLMLEPADVLDVDIDTLDAWVQRGNTLVLAGTGRGTRLVAQHYRFSLHFANNGIASVLAQNPLLDQPPIADAITLETDYYLASMRGDYVAYLADENTRPVLVAFQVGEGRVILSSAPSLFSNLGLKAENAPEAVFNLLRLAGNNSPVWFNEWHHGERGPISEVLGPEQWLRHNPIGRAMLFIAGVIFLGILLQGRLFGRPVPPARELRRRAPLEYIRAIANLGRRAGHRGPVMNQYHSALKRRLGKRYHLDPSLPDDDYVALLGRYNPTLDQPALLSLLTNLQKKRLGESEMVRLAAEAAEWLNES